MSDKAHKCSDAERAKARERMARRRQTPEYREWLRRSRELRRGLKEKYRRLTKLRLDPDNGDLIVEGDITSYETTALAVTSQEVASQNRLTVTVKIKYTNIKHPEESFEKSFVAFEDYASTMSLDAVESSLVDSIVEKIVDLIFNDTVAKW